MNNKINAFILFLTLVLIFTPMLISCSQGTNEMDDKTTAAGATGTESDEENAANEKERERLYPNVPDTDWDGRVLRVLGRVNTTYDQFTNFEIYAETEDGEIVNDAVFRRNADIQEKYNVTISQTLVDDTASTLSKFVNAGDDMYDFAFIRFEHIAPLAQNGFLYNLNTLDYIDFSKPWWNENVNRCFSMVNKLYYTTSDFTLMDKNRTFITLYNRDLGEMYDMINPYDLIKDNKWTIDKMHEMCAAVAGDVNGDGVMDNLDRYGACVEYYSFYVMAVGAGNTIASKDANDLPIIHMNNDHMIASIDKIMSLLCDKSITIFVDDFLSKEPAGWDMGPKMFNENRALFAQMFPHSLKTMSSITETNYGVITNPKFDEKQDTYRTTAVQAMVVAIPVSCSEPNFPAFMLEVLSAYSRYTTLPAFYEVACKIKYTYDVESAEMLDLTFSDIVYDIGSLYNWGGLAAILQVEIPSSKQNNFVSLYAAKESKALADLQKTTDAFLALE